MTPVRLTLALVLALACAAGCASLRNALRGPDPVSVAEVVDMSKAGVPPEEIIDEIQRSGTVYRLSASELANLRQQGVSDQVIDEMQRTYLEAVAQDQAFADWDAWSMGPDGYWYGGYPYGWGGWAPGWGGPGWAVPVRRR